MKIPWSKILNYLLLLLILVLLAGFQNTFWYQLFNTVPAPMLWLCLVVYVVLYRKPYSALLTVYVMALALMGFTAMPLKMLLLTLFIIFTVLYSIRSRVFWEGPAYYTLMCGVAAASYHVVYFVASWILERNSASLIFWDRLIQLILTPAFCFPMFWVLNKIDKLTLNEWPSDSRGYEL